MIKKLGLTIIMVLCLSLSVASEAMAAVKFADVKAGHWAEDSISWGIDKGIIEGYPNNTFKPNNAVTVAEFLKMLISSYNVEVPQPKEGEKWFEPYYDIAIEHKWAGFTEGVHDRHASIAISRGEVARAIASADGKVFPVIDDAILYLYEKGYSNGKKDKTIEGYAAQDTLTRAEAIKFIKNFSDLRDSNSLAVAKVQQVNAPMNSIEKFVEQMKFVAEKYDFEIVLLVTEGLYSSVNLNSDKYGVSAFSLSYHANTEGKSVAGGSFNSDIDDIEIINEILKAYTATSIPLNGTSIEPQDLSEGIKITRIESSDKLNFVLINYEF